MKGDMKMINYFIELWSQRFKQNIHLNDSKIQYITHKLDPLLIRNWDLCANDFHCNPNLLKIVKKQYNLYSEDYIQKLICEYSSKKNKRIQNKKQNEEEYKDWKIIQKYVRYQQKNMNFY